jgi:hypothetical protein
LQVFIEPPAVTCAFRSALVDEVSLSKLFSSKEVTSMLSNSRPLKN